MTRRNVEVAASKVEIDVFIDSHLGPATGSLDDWGFADPDTTAQDVLSEMQADNDKLSALNDWSLLDNEDLTIRITVRSGKGTTKVEW